MAGGRNPIRKGVVSKQEELRNKLSAGLLLNAFRNEGLGNAVVTVIVPVMPIPVVPVVTVVSVTHDHYSSDWGANYPGVPVMMIIPVVIARLALERKG